MNVSSDVYIRILGNYLESCVSIVLDQSEFSRRT